MSWLQLCECYYSGDSDGIQKDVRKLMFNKKQEHLKNRKGTIKEPYIKLVCLVYAELLVKAPNFSYATGIQTTTGRKEEAKDKCSCSLLPAISQELKLF
jgi:hypothetical protein